MQREKKTIFISWQPYCSRSDNFAREFNGRSYTIYFEFFGSNYLTIMFKYIFQAITTLIILFRDMPDVVFVMSPPVFASIPVFFYCVLFGKKYIIDAHTGALKDSMWQNVMFLQRFFSRRAVFTIVTNMELTKIMIRWNADYLVVPDVPIKIANPSLPDLKGKTNITLVNTFAKDEPLAEFLEAAKNFPGVSFFITGKIGKKNKVKYAEENIKFTGFIPYSDYYGLLLKSDVIAVLTTRDNTMQRGAYEAIYLGRPVITSGWPILKNNFDEGAVFVDNTKEGIANGIDEALKNLPSLKEGADRLKERKIGLWKSNKSEIISRILCMKDHI